MPEITSCPRCGCICDRDEVDIGVGIQYGPWHCPRCGWDDKAPCGVPSIIDAIKPLVFKVDPEK